VELPRTPSFRLDGKRALVTGAGRGIGLAAAAALADAGAEVFLVARTEKEIAAAAAAMIQQGGQAHAAPMDVTDRQAVESLVRESGPFHVLVNNAGTNRPAPCIGYDEADFDAIMNLNVRAAYFVASAVASALVSAREEGSIINVSSQMGHPAPGRRQGRGGRFHPGARLGIGRIRHTSQYAMPHLYRNATGTANARR